MNKKLTEPSSLDTPKTQNENLEPQTEVYEERDSYKKTNRLGTDSILSLLMSFGLPSVFALIVNASHPLINAAFLARGVGDVGLTAMTVVFPSAIMILALTVLIGSGGNALMAIKFGEKEHKEAERVMGNSFLLMIAFSLAFTTLGLVFHKQILMLSGATVESLPYAMAYQEIIFLGVIFNTIGFGMINFMRTTGAPVRAMFVMLAAAITNIALDYLLVIVFDMGMRGAGIATVSAQALSTILVLQYFFSKRTPIHFHFKTMKPDLALIKKILYLGLSSFVMQVASVFVNITINATLSKHGNLNPTIGAEGALAGMGVVIRTAQFAVIPVMGFVVASQPIIGYNFGAKQIGRVRKALGTTIVIVTIIHTAFWAVIQLFPGTIISIFGISDPDVMDFAITALRVSCIMIPIVGYQMTVSSYFQSTGQPKIASILTLSRQVLFLLPFIIYGPTILSALGVSNENIIFGIPAAMAVSDLGASLFTTYFLIRDLRKLKRAEEKGDFSELGEVEKLSAA